MEKYAYDPWGARRNADDWTQKDTRTKWITNRGYTGHEHIDAFGVINMNGRVYDPATGMFMSPDPYIQAPGDWLNYNRYGYCMGNPFKYSDPSGYNIFGDVWNWVKNATSDVVSTVGKIAAWSLLIVPSSIDAISSGDWSRLDPFKSGTISNNAYKIGAGLFKTDPNRNFWDRSWQLISRFTFELPQTFIGFSYTQMRNAFGSVDRVDYLGGATFATNENSDKNNGITIGSYININIQEKISGDFVNYVISHPMYMHEYGHTIDSENYGLSFLFVIGLPSLFNCWLSDPLPINKWKGKNVDNPYNVNDHDIQWYEMHANKNASDYFSKYYNVNWKDYPNYPTTNPF